MSSDPASQLPRDPAAVASHLAARRTGPARVGLELEMALVRRRGLAPVRYEGPDGVGALLARIAASDASYAPELEGPNLIALRRPDGQSITLEPGGQLELATAPAEELLALERLVQDETASLARLADEQGLALVGGGLAPFAQEAMPWMPKSRYQVMRAHFAALGQAGRLAPVMMQRTLSVQVSLDWADEHEAAALMRLGFLAAPVLTAAWACSPLDGPREAGFLSWRAEAWRFTDPFRSGDVPACAAAQSTLEDYARWALDAPLLFRLRDGAYEPAPAARWGELLALGRWPDGAPLEPRDFAAHLSSLFPNVRLKRGVLELRSTDGQAPADVMAIPALWVGLCYDAQARSAAEALLLAQDPAGREAALRDAPRLALQARWGRRSLLELARELLLLAEAGLLRRVARGEERPGVERLLQPLARRLERGVSPADELLASWRGAWQRDPRGWVEALAFPVPARRG